MFSAMRFLSRRSSVVASALLCSVLILTSLPLPSFSTRAQSADRVQKRRLPPHYALPKINDLLDEGRKLHRPDLPRPALKPSTLCGYHAKPASSNWTKKRKSDRTSSRQPAIRTAALRLKSRSTPCGKAATVGLTGLVE